MRKKRLGIVGDYTRISYDLRSHVRAGCSFYVRALYHVEYSIGLARTTTVVIAAGLKKTILLLSFRTMDVGRAQACNTRRQTRCSHVYTRITISNVPRPRGIYNVYYMRSLEQLHGRGNLRYGGTYCSTHTGGDDDGGGYVWFFYPRRRVLDYFDRGRVSRILQYRYYIL